MTNQTSTPTPPAAPRPDSNRFFTWLRSLGVVRADGWIGGVCGGIALRTGLDPLIVRGIAVVIAILGGPALFFYAAAWLLLPDTHGEIHLERMLRGIFDAPLIAIGILVVLTFIPLTQGVWWLGGHLAGSAWWIAGPTDVLRVLWNLAIVGVIVWFVVWLVRRVRNTPPGGYPASGAAAAPAPADAAAPASADAAAPASDSSPSGSPQANAGTGTGTTQDDLREWRERYDAWRAQHQAWQEQQRAQLHTARDARSAEVRARSIAFAQQAEQRRAARRAANPRAAGWVVALVLGAALLAGGIAGAVAAGHGDLARYAAPIGMAAALMTIGLGMVVAGAAKRRSGSLASLAIIALVLGLGSFGWPVHDSPVGFTQLRADRDVTFNQFAGQIELDASQAEVGDSTRHVTITQTFGAVAVYIGDGVHARVEVTSRGSDIHPRISLGDGRVTEQPSIPVQPSHGATTAERSWDNLSGGSPDLVVDVAQGRGAVYIYEGGANPSSSNGYLD